ncbi:MAG: 50S ribosomal protein L30, partial [Halobacteria archaeon]|nr:50S ribosomal protein L30 [Halobacteria archaeon]
IKLTQTKSSNGRQESHKATARGLGLRHIRQTVEVEDTPEIRGMIKRISYMVRVEE